MSSSNIHTPNTSSSKGGGTVIQRRQRNTNTNGSNTGGSGMSTSTTSTSMSYNHHHHNSYYYGGRGIGGGGGGGSSSISIDGGSSSLSSSMRERLSTNPIPQMSQPPPPHSSLQLYNTDYNNTIVDYPVTSPPANQLQHVALHIDNNNNYYYDHKNTHNRYYKNGDEVMDRSSSNNYYYSTNSDNNYDPEQPQLHSPSSLLLSSSSSYSNTTQRMTEEQIRRFNNNYEQHQQQQQQPSQSIISSMYHHHTKPTTTATTPTTTVMSNMNTKPIPIWKRKMVLEEDFYRIEDYHTIFRNPHHMTDAQYTKYVQLQQHYMVHGNNNNNSNNYNNTSAPSTSMMNKTCCAYTCSMFSALAVFFLLWVGILLDTQPLYIPGALPTITVQSVTQNQQQQQQPPYSSTTNQRNDYKQRQQKGQGRQQQRQSQSRRTTPRIQFIIPGKNDERLLIAKTAYQAATMYFITMIISRYIYDPIPFHTFYNTHILSVFQRCYSRMTGQRGFSMNSQRHSYTDIPELQSQYDMIGNYASNPVVSSSSMEGLILAGGVTNGGNGITLLPYATSAPTQQRSVWFSSSSYTTSLWTRTSNTMKRYLASKGWYQPSRRRNRHHYEIKKTG